MKIELNSGIPLYTAGFLDDTTVVVAGGGGMGAHGVANKVLVYDVSEKASAPICEHVLPPHSDSPTSMTVAPASPTSLPASSTSLNASTNVVWLGANVPTAHGLNHLSKLVLKEGKLHVAASYDLFGNRDVAVYQKATSAVSTLVLAAQSGEPGEIRLLTTSGTPGDVVSMSFRDELVDAALSEYDENEHRYVAAASETEIEVRSVSSPLIKYVPSIPAPTGSKWTRVVAVRPGKFVATSVPRVPKSPLPCQLSVIRIEEFGKAKITHTVALKGVKGVTALATNGQRVVVGTSTGDVLVYNVQFTTPSLKASFRNVHKLPVTAVALSASGEAAASTSLNGTLVVHSELSDAVSLKATMGWAVLSAVLIMAVALALSVISFPMMGFEGTPSIADIGRSFHELPPEFVVPSQPVEEFVVHSESFSATPQYEAVASTSTSRPVVTEVVTAIEVVEATEVVGATENVEAATTESMEPAEFEASPQYTSAVFGTAPEPTPSDEIVLETMDAEPTPETAEPLEPAAAAEVEAATPAEPEHREL